MKILKISRGLETKIDDEDYRRIKSVPLNYRSKALRWQATYTPSDKKHNYYVSKTINYKKWKLHRYIFYLRGIDIEGKEIDHINGDTLDNRFSNLRIATSSQNKVNRMVRSDSKSGYKGVEYHNMNKNWIAYIVKNGKKTHLGVFDTKHKAALAYNRAAIELWGEYAWTNKVPRTTAP